MSLTQRLYLQEEIPASVKKTVAKVIDDLFEGMKDHNLPFTAESDDELEGLQKLARKILAKFNNIIFVGTGASYTIPKMIIDFFDKNQKNFFFIRNLSAHQINNITSKLHPQETLVIAISKSGESIEVITNFLKLHEWFNSHLEPQAISEHFLTISEEKFSPLFCLSEKIKCQNINHPNVGGRFSVFTVVGLLPALLVGLEINKIMHFIKEKTALIIKEKKQLIEGISYNYYFSNKGLSSALLSYGEYFNGYNDWYKQLIAESLGKQNKGIIPITAIGAYDQHVQLQLFIDGIKDMYFTIISFDQISEDTAVKNYTGLETINYLVGKSFNHILSKNRLVVESLLKKKNKNLRIITIDNLSEESITELIILQIIELMVYARLIGVNPFGQPAVENIKLKIEEAVKK